MEIQKQEKLLEKEKQRFFKERKAEIKSFLNALDGSKLKKLKEEFHNQEQISMLVAKGLNSTKSKVYEGFRHGYIIKKLPSKWHSFEEYQKQK